MRQKGIDSRSDQSATPRKFNRKEESPEWVKNLPRYDNPSLWLAIEQLVGTFVPYFLLLSLMLVTIRLGVSYWATFLLALMAVPFYMRIFIFFHDCGHGSFFRNRKANTILAYVCGILTFTPFEQWRHDHALHHAGVANLDRRGRGAIRIMTVDEYLGAPLSQRIKYRLYQNPFIMFGLGYFYTFIILYRFPHLDDDRKRRLSVFFTDLALAAIVVTAWYHHRHQGIPPYSDAGRHHRRDFRCLALLSSA